MRKWIILIAAIAVVLWLPGCRRGTPDSDPGDDPADPPAVALTFDLSGATALAAGAITGARNPDAEDAFQLVKVLEDGSVEPVMHLAEGASGLSLPRIVFIAKSPIEGSKDVYVAFESSIAYWVDGYTGQDGVWHDGQTVNLGSFLHLDAEGTCFGIVEDTTGQVAVNGSWGAEDFRPVDFDSAGNVYFLCNTWTAYGTVSVLYKYTPGSGQKATPLTPPVEGYGYETFRVDPSGTRLFVKGSRWSGSTTSYFLRMYPLANTAAFKNIYYSSTNDVWVNGFEIAPSGDYIVLNGWNVRGYNGIIRADIIDDATLVYRPLYTSSDGSTDYFDPVYREEYRSWEDKTYYWGLFDEVESWRVRVLMTDGAAFRYAPLEQVRWTSESDAVVTFWEDSVEQSLEIGVDWWFATSATDATARDESNYYWSAFEATGKAICRLEWWYWDELGEHSMYKDLPTSVTAFYNDPANYTSDGSSHSLIYPKIYIWDEHWYGDQSYSSGALDSAAILQYVGPYFISDTEFVYGGLSGDAGFGAALADEPYVPQEVYGSGSSADPWFFLDEHVYLAGGSMTKATSLQDFRTENGLTWLDYQCVRNLFFDADGSLWGVLDQDTKGPKPIRLLDAEGRRNLMLTEAFRDNTYKPVGFAVRGDHVYFRDAVRDSDNQEMGYHRMYRFLISDEHPTMEDCLTNVPDNGWLEILDFSIDEAGTWLYFTAVSGLSIVGGKVDLDNGMAYTPFDTAMRLSLIEVF